MKFANLTIIIPTTRGGGSIPTIRSALDQTGFGCLFVVVTGKSTVDQQFLRRLGDEFRMDKVHIVQCRNKKTIFPGEARNDGLKYIYEKKLETEYVLFLDDDVIIPRDYSRILASFMEKGNSCAAMGRISSVPVNYWTKIIDYSNFWWLQVKKSNLAMSWLATTATLTKERYVRGLFFEEDIEVNEDVIFFKEVAKKTKKLFSICAETTGEHRHNRKDIKEFIRYQFSNGKKGVLYHNNIVHPVMALLSVCNNYRKAFVANKVYFYKNKMVAIGVFVSFVIYETGIQYTSFIRMLKIANRYLNVFSRGWLKRFIRKMYRVSRFHKLLQFSRKCK